MRDRVSVAVASGFVVVATLACKGSSGPGDAAGGPAASASAAPAGCAESAKELSGSLHAEVAYGAPFDPPKSKRKQSYQCGTRFAVALILEYPAAAPASAACNFIGPQLWGGGAPTPEDKDELMTKAGSIAIVSGDAIAELATKLEGDGWVRWRAPAAPPQAVDVDIGKAIDCGPTSKDPLRAWCAVVPFETSGFAFPTSPKTYVGITAAVKTGVDVKTALLGDASVSALSLGPGRAKLTSVTPDNEGEKKTLAATAMAVAAALRGEGKSTIAVGKDLAAFLDGRASDLAITGASVAASPGRPATFKGSNPSEIALVHAKAGDAYVVLEHVKEGTWVSVFPVRAYGP